ncbi:MAG: translation initiation factor IF-3 [Gammaproteobacteria bacterium]|nr:translation initiation factor IF-3 [Gammaproteobacteria bacterium]
MANEKKNRVNGEITSPQVRVIGAEGENVGVVTIEQALQLAQDSELDLVEIVPNAEPPVARVMDFGKYLFELSKKKHAAKRRQKTIQVKEVKFRPGTDEGDYQIKLRNLKKFLEHGDKVKVTLRFRGREMAHQELGARMLQRVESDLGDLGAVEHFPKMEGRQMVMVIAPKRVG